MPDLSARPDAPASSTTVEPCDLDTAIRVAQRMHARYGTVDSGDIFDYAQAHGGLTEALRILLRAVGAEPVDEQEAARRSVDAQFPAVTAFLASERGEQQ